MTLLNNEYQYIGRSSAVRAYGYDYYYYILLYAKTIGSPETGRHTVSIKMRLACDTDATFYGFDTSGSVRVDGVSAISWESKEIPATYWGDSKSLSAGGVTYPRWTELQEGAVEIDTEYLEKEITITASWKRLAISTTPPNWLPSTTEATASIPVTLPEIAGAPVVPDDDPEAPDVAPAAVEGIRVYADGVLAYDSRLEGYELVGLKITTGVNIGGTAEIIMPPGHPAYNYFTSRKTVITIYRGGKLRFRGRALYSSENFYGQRTITCEGELCFLRDSINRPYVYQATPRSCFVTIINAHNSSTDPEKVFRVGEVTVTDPNDYIRLESESAETTMATLNKLVERCGGYIVFTTAADGSRVINWLESLESRSGQTIEFGENLLDFSSTGANSDSLVTGIVPYGARNADTKKRITIESVNGGKDYLIAEDAQATRGTIMTTVTWDDVTEPANLLKKAQAYLDANKVFITSLELTALDLSYLDKDLDSFSVGDMIHVISAPHGINEYFQLSKMTENLLSPESSSIILGKDIQSLTGSDVAGDTKSQNDIESVKVKYDTDIDKVTGEVEQSVLSKVSTIYVPQNTLDALAASLSEADATLQAQIEANEEALDTHEKNAQATYATQTSLTEYKQQVAGFIGKVNGVVHIGGGAPISMLGGKIDINGSEINFAKEIRFLNESGIRIADKDGNFYYVLRVDAANSCVVGNDYTNLYLRGKDAVYLYKTGAVVTSDRREKNSTEELPEAYMAMLDKLTPVRFRYNGKGDRYHVGFIAQDVEQALTDAGLDRDDFGGLVDVDGHLGLAYDEFIGLLLEKIRRLENRLKVLEENA